MRARFSLFLVRRKKRRVTYIQIFLRGNSEPSRWIIPCHVNRVPGAVKLHLKLLMHFAGDGDAFKTGGVQEGLKPLGITGTD